MFITNLCTKNQKKIILKKISTYRPTINFKNI